MEVHNKIQIELPKELVRLIDKIIKKNPDFTDREFLIQYCIRKYFDDVGNDKRKV